MAKHLVLLHTANPSRIKHFERLRAEDLHITLLMKNPTWEKSFADQIVDIDSADPIKVVEATKELNAQRKIDGVLTFAEYSVPLAAAISDTLKLNFVSKETALLARDKYRMRLAYKEKGVKIPRIAVAKNLFEASLLSKEIGFPLILKPIIGGGSGYVRRINNDVELANYFSLVKAGAWNSYKSDPLFKSLVDHYQGGVLMEEYVEGGEISCESVVYKGTTRSVAIHDKPLPMQGPHFEELFYMTPTGLSREFVKEVYDQVKATNSALGIENGATHTEFRVTPKGPMIIETGARLGGSAVYRSVLASTGIDLVKATLDVALGHEPELTQTRDVPTGFVCFYAKRAGRVVGLGTLPEIEKRPEVIEVQTYKGLGSTVDHGFSGHGHILFQGKDRSDVFRLGNEFLGLADLDVERVSHENTAVSC